MEYWSHGVLLPSLYSVVLRRLGTNRCTSNASPETRNSLMSNAPLLQRSMTMGSLYSRVLVS